MMAMARRQGTRGHEGRPLRLSALVGPSLSVPIRDGRLGLGQFQRIVLVEFEGPRQRLVEVDLLPASIKASN
jgi:thiamine phosphate synthase YjbQ (UPF0047 family)